MRPYDMHITIRYHENEGVTSRTDQRLINKDVKAAKAITMKLKNVVPWT